MASGSSPHWPSAGLALFLAGVLLMVSGEWPQFAVPDTRVALPLRLLGWPWLYLSLFGVSFAVLVAKWPTGVVRRTTADFMGPAIALTAAAFLFSVALSQVQSLSWLAFGSFLVIVGFGFAVAHIVEDETALSRASVTIAIAALLLAVRVLIWRFDQGLATATFHVRTTAWLGKIQIAWVLNLVAPLLMARFIEARAPFAVALYGVAWLLSGAANHVLFARTGSLAFALTTLLMCALNIRYWRRWAVLLGVFVVVALAVIAGSAGMSGYVVSSLVYFGQDSGVVMREGVWRDTLRMVVDHPFTGIGLGTYDDVAYSRYGMPADRHFFRNGWHAHNVFLHLLAETGIIGFAAWCYLWYTIVRFLALTWRRADALGRLNSSAALCVLLAFLVVSLTDNVIAARVHGSLRMNLTLALLVVYGIRVASRPPLAAPETCPPGTPPAAPRSWFPQRRWYMIGR